MQREKQQHACCNHPLPTRISCDIFKHSVHLTDLWFCAWCSCTCHLQVLKNLSGRKNWSKAWLPSQKVDEKNVACTRCNAILLWSGLTSATANIADGRVECTIRVFPQESLGELIMNLISWYWDVLERTTIKWLNDSFKSTRSIHLGIVLTVN